MDEATMQERYDATRVLVTGASGFIGTHLCKRLANLGAEVHGVSRREQSEKGVLWWRGDLADADDASRVVQGVRPDYVFNLASVVAGARDMAMVQPAFEGNLASAVHLMVAAAEAGVTRFVQMGSQEEPAHGDVPASPYAAAKAAATAYAHMFHSLYRFPVVHLRVFMVYGPAQRDLTKLVPYSILETLHGKPPKIGSGTRQVDWIYVDDVVNACLTAGAAPDIDGESLDVGTGTSATIREVVEKIVEQINPELTPEFGAVADRQNEVVRVANPVRSDEQMGWAPKVDLDEGLRRTISWYRSQVDAGLIKAKG